MPHQSDHARRDAEHAARSAIRVEMAKFVRRMDDLAKAEIAEALADANTKGKPVDGTALGQAAATRAISAYTGGGEPQAAIDAEAS